MIFSTATAVFNVKIFVITVDKNILFILANKDPLFLFTSRVVFRIPRRGKKIGAGRTAFCVFPVLAPWGSPIGFVEAGFRHL